MKKIYSRNLFLVVLLTTTMIGCSKVLEEQPRSSFTPDFFQSEQGVRGGISALYASLRGIYGNAYYYNTGETGTDEYTYAQSADQNFKVMDMTEGQGIVTSSTSRADVLWDRAFRAINTASGIIENGTEAGVDPSLVAEAQFFRGFYYFQLVQTFGGVPLDFGGGELKFNTTPSRESVRNTVPEVYTRGVFVDLNAAVENLPEDPRLIGTATKTLARLYLAQAYLTYGWWLENPNSIPTYPATDRTDPDGHNAGWYYQQAYDVATAAINNPGPFGLQETYYDVNYAPNDRNNEILMFADHTETSEFYNGASLTYSNGEDDDNFAGWMGQWNYTEIRSSSSSSGWTNVESVQREAVQSLGRPWIRMAPPVEVFTNTFSDKTSDSRYDGTFVTSYRANLNASGVQGPVYNANMMPINDGDAVLTFLPENNSGIVYPIGAGNNGVGAGELPGRSDFVIDPQGISRVVYPGLWKLGSYRTDNDGGLGEPNAASTRPFNIAKFSELYFIAAEAAVKGASGSMSAWDLINVIRKRAGVWRWDNGGNQEKVADNSAAMEAATPSTITIDYILEERSREYFGEGKRWLDLIRTQKWGEVAKTYSIAGNDKGDHEAQTFERNIEEHLYLRPIPSGQLDAMQVEEDVKKAYQNPGYN